MDENTQGSPEGDLGDLVGEELSERGRDAGLIKPRNTRHPRGKRLQWRATFCFGNGARCLWDASADPQNPSPRE